MIKEKPDCYECEYRGTNPGSYHSKCEHPSFKDANNDSMLNIMSMFANVGRMPPINVKNNKCKVKGNSHGIKNGWFNHPHNFDPTWLEECSGYKNKG